MGQEIIPADIVPGYKFGAIFDAPAPEVANAEGVREVAGAKLGIPDEHNFNVVELPSAEGQAKRLSKYLGSVTFMDLEGSGPSVLNATIHIDVLAPGRIARAVASVRRRPPVALLSAQGDGVNPFDDGYGARPVPVPPALPTGSRDLVRV
jgi:hypothetical protein